MIEHLAIAPILIPLATAALQLFLDASRFRLHLILTLASGILLCVTAFTLLARVGLSGQALVYNLSGWTNWFAIVLVVDHLSALMLTLTAVLGLATMPYALSRWRYMGTNFQPLIQLFLLGFNGVFLTGDLFNLFVFLEVLLAASYGLVLHGSGPRRISAGLHYITINLVASMLFLLGLSLIFGVTGTLNMAVLARMMPNLDGNTLILVHTGAVLIALTFLTKAAIWPLGFWLPRTYSAATPPAASLFALMTKLGLYVVLRLSLLLLGPAAGAGSQGFGQGWLLWAGIITTLVGAIGILGARELAKLIGYAVIISSGTLLGAFALQQEDITAGALAYTVISALGIAGFFLLSGLIIPGEKPDGTDQLEPYDPATDELYTQEDESRVETPASILILSVCFLACGLWLAGLPPFASFLAKFAMLAPMPGHSIGAIILFASTLMAGLCSTIAISRAGIQIFWADTQWVFPYACKREVFSVATLIAIGLLLSFTTAPWQYFATTARHIHAPTDYIQAVLPVNPGDSQ